MNGKKCKEKWTVSLVIVREVPLTLSHYYDGTSLPAHALRPIKSSFNCDRFHSTPTIYRMAENEWNKHTTSAVATTMHITSKNKKKFENKRIKKIIKTQREQMKVVAAAATRNRNTREKKNQ